MNERLIKKLVSTVKCNVCGVHYELANIDIIGHRDGTWFLNIFCPTCDRESFVAAIIKKENAQEIVTGVTEEKFTASVRADLISSNDLLNLHNFLKDFDGDFIKLFSQR
jgi:transcription elongation factor Elf1